ncbi:cytochrome P450 [Saccharopolyspora sp. WRP15-2]|uniref:Cytochrome P450 n=1 Tax=Saccharopolyspora oryzae TaxID=2997343 RepID=A0ABT4UVC0_9PSEU|nr:cytochrome P450 [Saccharopolyspora oryzae]MDA3625650.1 cytochrome P450 [Saccharopolyspora oryzae]
MNAPIQLPFDQQHPLEFPPQVRALQTQGAVHEVRTEAGDRAWLVTSYALVRRLLADERLGRSHPAPERAARVGESALFGGPQGDFETEQADHARMRELLQPHFSPKRMRELRSRVEALADELLDGLAEKGPPADLHDALALPLPILVICELLGVPYEDRDLFRAWTQAAADVTDRARSERGLADLFDYGRQLVARKRRDPGDDVISRLCAADGMGDDEVAMLSMALLFAGHETTVVQIGMGALLLLTNRAQWRALLAEPGLVPGAVEEILRMPVGGGGGGGIPRYARTEFDIDGVTVHAGDLVLLHPGAANRDRAVFADPDSFDIARKPFGHLSFGHGPRYCVGAPLARIELHAVFSRLLARFPAMRLAVPLDQLELRRGSLAGGLVELPVTWREGAP